MEKHPVEAETFSRLGHKVFNHIENMGKPVIAAVNVMPGWRMRACSSLRHKDCFRTRKIGQPEINLGLIPVLGDARLPRLIGMGRLRN